MHERIYTAPYLIRTQLIGILKIIVKLYNKLCINAEILYISLKDMCDASGNFCIYSR